MKKQVSIFLIFILFLQSFIGVGKDIVHAAYNGDLQFAIQHGSKQIVLGKQTTLYAKVTNNETNDWAYNLTYAIALGDGLEYVEDPLYPASDHSVSTDGVQNIVWKDMKDLAPQETYMFPISIQSLESYRYHEDQRAVAFGDDIAITMSVAASDDARNLPQAGDGPSDVITMEIVPFEINVNHTAAVKGAGPNDTPPDHGQNWGEMTRFINLVNNTRTETVIDLENRVHTAVEVYQLSDAADEEIDSTSDPEWRQWEWSNLQLAAGETRKLSYKEAFLEQYPDQSAIQHGDTVTHTLAYTAIVDSESYTGNIDYTANAKDISIHKAVDKSVVKYGDTVTYTIHIKTNEYEDVADVVVTDTLGDGQDFLQYLDVQGVEGNPQKNSDGTTTITWDLGTLAKQSTMSISYTAHIRDEWAASYNGGPIYAGDSIHNAVSIAGVTDASGYVQHSSDTSISVNEPHISEKIVKINDVAMDAKAGSVTVGDRVYMDVKYDARNIGAKQHDVALYNFLPLGTVLESNDLSSYALNGVAPSYESSNHLLVWELGDLPDNTGELSTTLEIIVEDSGEFVKADKGAENLLVLSYANSPQRIVSKRDSVKLQYTEPAIEMERKVKQVSVKDTRTVDVYGSEMVDIAITLRNHGDTTAYNIQFVDVLGEQLENPTIIQDDFTFNSNDRTLTFDEIEKLEPLQSVTFTYTADVTDPIGSGYVIYSNASADYYGQPQQMTPVREYTASEVNNPVMQVERPAVTKKVIDTTTGSKANVRIGDWVVYQLEVNLPTGAVAYEPKLIDTISNNQTFLEMFTTYHSDGNGQWSPAGEQKSVAGNNVTISNLAVSTEATYTYYVKTRVDDIKDGVVNETQKSTAIFEWQDPNDKVGKLVAQSNPAAVQVRIPNLRATITPASKEMNLNDEVDYTFSVKNVGRNTAYGFTPSVTIPAGFDIISTPVQTAVYGDVNKGYTLTFDTVSTLFVNHSVDYNFTMSLVSLKDAGENDAVYGDTGPYYTNNQAYVNDTDADHNNNPELGKEKYSSSKATGVLNIPKVWINNRIKRSSNEGRIDEIRPGDTIDYELTVTVPKGTNARNITIRDTFDLLNMFDVISVTDEKGQPDLTATWSNSTLSMVLGDVIAKETDTDATTIVRHVQLQVKNDGSSVDTGSVTQLIEAVESSAVVRWATEEGKWLQSAKSKTNVDVVQPKLMLSKIGLLQSEFSETVNEIQIGYKLKNEGETNAFNGVVEVDIPTGLTVVPQSISNQGTLSSDGNKVIWTQLHVNQNAETNVTFTVTPDTLAAGVDDIIVPATLTSYTSKFNTPYKTYKLNQTIQHKLSTAPPQLSAVMKYNTNNDQTNVTPGDEVTYEVNIDIPNGLHVYDAVLKFEQTEQMITEVFLPNGDKVELKGGGYHLEHITRDMYVTVKAITPTDSSQSSNSYYTSFEPILHYETALQHGVSKQATVSQAIILQVGQPDLSISLTSNESEFTQVGDTITYTLEVNNEGQSTAYDAVTYLSVTDAVYVTLKEPTVSDAVYGDASWNDARNELKWDISSLRLGEKQVVTFDATAKKDTAVGAELQFEAEINQYFSRPVADYKQYGPVNTNKVNAVVKGQHMLLGNGYEEVTAGNSVRFTHTLHNTGAGKDEFALTFDSPFQVTRVDDDRQAMTLAADEKRDIIIEVVVPEQTPYDTTHIVTVKATGKNSGKESTTQNTVKVLGSLLDGWSGSEQQADWELTNYGENDIATFQAISAVNVEDVTVTYGQGTNVQTHALIWMNTTSYISDGYKEWIVSVPLDQSVAASTLFTPTFHGYHSQSQQIEQDAYNGVNGANNPFYVYPTVDVVGTITDIVDDAVMEGASVRLLHRYSEEETARTATAANGTYIFKNVSVAEYILDVSAEAYADTQVEFYALPESGAEQVIVDAQLAPYQITLMADPETILGDGKSETILQAMITDLNGEPLSGANVLFSSPTNRGTFPQGTTAITDEDGKASLPFRSDEIIGTSSIRFPVLVEVSDEKKKLYATDQIYIVFNPGAVAGVVTEIDENGMSQPVGGAIVIITKDMDGDGVIDFSAKAITKEDGSYQISVPKSNTDYDIEVTKQVQIGKNTTPITFKQKAEVGQFPISNHDVFPSDKTGAGMVLFQSVEQETLQYPKELYEKMKGYLLDSNGDIVLNHDQSIKYFSIEEQGVFHIPNLKNGTYQLVVLMEVTPGVEIIINEDRNGNYAPLMINQDGELNLSEVLIDPYGIVTDAVTGKSIENAHVHLYYADTQRNRDHNITPGELVILPELVGFDPNDNRNPQDSDAYGFYAYMVYPYTDYKVVVTKPGYITYNSPAIEVGTTMVRHDVSLKPIIEPSEPSKPSNNQTTNRKESDLSIEIFSDKAMYGEGDNIYYTLQYRNDSEHAVNQVEIQAQIPRYTSMEDAAGGNVNGQMVSWNVGTLQAGETGEIMYSVVVGEDVLPQAEVIVNNEAKIASKAAILVNTLNDTSSIQVMLHSDRFGSSLHHSYIVGYPDGEFKPNREITRGEIAGIFARIMDLEHIVTEKKMYDDIPTDHWAAAYIEAVTRAELFGGYDDGSFRPDQAITRAELSAVIAKYLNLNNSEALNIHFTDVENHWAVNYIEHMYRHHIIVGNPDGSFKPSDPMIRAEAVTMINRLLHRGPLTNVDVSFPDVPADHWAFGEVEESTRTHRYDRLEDGTEQMTEFIPDPLW